MPQPYISFKQSCTVSVETTYSDVIGFTPAFAKVLAITAPNLQLIVVEHCWKYRLRDSVNSFGDIFSWKELFSRI